MVNRKGVVVFDSAAVGAAEVPTGLLEPTTFLKGPVEADSSPCEAGLDGGGISISRNDFPSRTGSNVDAVAGCSPLMPCRSFPSGSGDSGDT